MGAREGPQSLGGPAADLSQRHRASLGDSSGSRPLTHSSAPMDAGQRGMCREACPARLEPQPAPSFSLCFPTAALLTESSHLQQGALWCVCPWPHSGKEGVSSCAEGTEAWGRWAVLAAPPPQPPAPALYLSCQVHSAPTADWAPVVPPPHHHVLVLEEAFPLGFCQELPGAAEPGLGHELKQAVLPGRERGRVPKGAGLGTWA